jgi:hypothetical protein
MIKKTEILLNFLLRVVIKTRMKTKAVPMEMRDFLLFSDKAVYSRNSAREPAMPALEINQRRAGIVDDGMRLHVLAIVVRRASLLSMSQRKPPSTVCTV